MKAKKIPPSLLSLHLQHVHEPSSSSYTVLEHFVWLSKPHYLLRFLFGRLRTLVVLRSVRRPRHSDRTSLPILHRLYDKTDRLIRFLILLSDDHRDGVKRCDVHRSNDWNPATERVKIDYVRRKIFVIRRCRRQQRFDGVVCLSPSKQPTGQIPLARYQIKTIIIRYSVFIA